MQSRRSKPRRGRGQPLPLKNKSEIENSLEGKACEQLLGKSLYARWLYIYKSDREAFYKEIQEEKEIKKNIKRVNDLIKAYTDFYFDFCKVATLQKRRSHSILRELHSEIVNYKLRARLRLQGLYEEILKKSDLENDLHEKYLKEAMENARAALLLHRENPTLVLAHEHIHALFSMIVVYYHLLGKEIKEDSLFKKRSDFFDSLIKIAREQQKNPEIVTGNGKDFDNNVSKLYRLKCLTVIRRMDLIRHLIPLLNRTEFIPGELRETYYFVMYLMETLREWGLLYKVLLKVENGKCPFVDWMQEEKTRGIETFVEYAQEWSLSAEMTITFIEINLNAGKISKYWDEEKLWSIAKDFFNQSRDYIKFYQELFEKTQGKLKFSFWNPLNSSEKEDSFTDEVDLSPTELIDRIEKRALDLENVVTKKIKEKKEREKTLVEEKAKKLKEWEEAITASETAKRELLEGEEQEKIKKEEKNKKSQYTRMSRASSSHYTVLSKPSSLTINEKNNELPKKKEINKEIRESLNKLNSLSKPYFSNKNPSQQDKKNFIKKLVQLRNTLTEEKNDKRNPFVMIDSLAKSGDAEFQYLTHLMQKKEYNINALKICLANANKYYKSALAKIASFRKDLVTDPDTEVEIKLLDEMHRGIIFPMERAKEYFEECKKEFEEQIKIKETRIQNLDQEIDESFDKRDIAYKNFVKEGTDGAEERKKIWEDMRKRKKFNPYHATQRYLKYLDQEKLEAEKIVEEKLLDFLTKVVERCDQLKSFKEETISEEKILDNSMIK